MSAITAAQKRRLEAMAVELRELFPDRFIRPLSIGQALLDLAAVSGSDAMVIDQTLLLECDARVARLAVWARDIRAKEPQALAMHGKLTQDQRDIFAARIRTADRCCTHSSPWIWMVRTGRRYLHTGSIDWDAHEPGRRREGRA